MHKLSLILCTLGERPDDLHALLHSLVPQSSFLADVVVVDQHTDANRVPALLEDFRAHLPLRHTRSEKGLARARNHGLPLATGSLVAFPDDDCLYPQHLLEWVTAWFDSNLAYDILAVGAQDADGIPSGNRWPQPACDIRPINAFRTTFSSSLFLRTEVARQQPFDFRFGIGAGTSIGSGEETDYILRLLRSGARGRFDRARHILHPRRDMLSGATSDARARSYGFGMGHILRMHSLTSLWAGFLGYNVARAGLALARGNRDGSTLCFAHTQGLWHGYLTPSLHDTPRPPVLHSLATHPSPPAHTRGAAESVP